MGERGMGRDDSPAPPPTWGSTMIVSSGSNSIGSSQPMSTPPMRILDMHASPDHSYSDRHERGEAAPRVDLSSPVEEFSSPEKVVSNSKANDATSGDVPVESGDRRESISGSLVDGGSAPSKIRVGVWEVPDIREREAADVDIDPNGDDDQVEEQVARLITMEKEMKKRSVEEAIKRKRLEEEEVASSMPSQSSATGLDFTPSRLPQSSTPPLAKRQRRGIQEGQSYTSVAEPTTQSAPVQSPMNSRKATQDMNEEIEPTDLASLDSILNQPHDEESRNALVRYAQASPLIPDFLKEEIQRCINKADQSTQSQGSKSDSDTQEDGYLKTKAFWVFELLRWSGNGAILAGMKLESKVEEHEKTLVLHIFSNGSIYGVQMVDREPLMMSRNELRSNPWFDCHGHPFGILYQNRSSNKGRSHESSLSSPFVRTQVNDEQLSILQAEIQQLQEENNSLVLAKDESEKRCHSAMKSTQTTQESNEFLKEQYRLASNSAAESAREAEVLQSEVESLKRQLTEGMDTVRSFSQQHIRTLQTKLDATKSQLHLLVSQNQLTDDALREKAAKWDAYQAIEQARLREVERRRADISEESAALYQSMQEEESRRAANNRRPPHEHFLEVDLATQKVDLPGLDVQVDDEGIVVTPRIGAEEVLKAGGIDAGAERTSRTLQGRNLQAEQIRANSELAEDVLFQSQQQAQAEVADALQGELNYQTSELL
ncbi:hypothetical protein CBS101457_001139 [Exobasidium rhododendri]|nr:hypothetical protein CBS101457_001139 [Exobasidium rhododendri]